MLWLVFGTKATWLELGHYNILAQNAHFGRQQCTGKMSQAFFKKSPSSGNYPEISLKISSGLTHTNVGTHLLSSLATTNFTNITSAF